MALTSARVLMVEQTPQNGYCQCLCPQVELQFPPASLGGSPRSAGGSDPGSFQITALPWVSERVRLCVCSLRVEFPFPTAPWLSPEMSPIGLQCHTFWRLVFLVQDAQAGEPAMGL